MSKKKLTLRCPKCKKNVQLENVQNKTTIRAPYYGNFYQCKCPNCGENLMVSGRVLG